MKTSLPSVAAIVLNYNGKEFLNEALTSLLKQSYKNYQIYVADDCSTDDSIDYLKNNFPKVTILRAPHNMGPAGVSNFAVDKIKEEYIVLMSNDMKFDKNCLSELLQTALDDKKVGIATAVLVRYHKDPMIDDYRIDNAGGNLDIYGCGMPHARDKIFSKYPHRIEEIFYSYGGCFIIKKTLFRKIGGFDSVYFGLSDDIDLSWRIRLLGYKVVVNPKSFLYHNENSPTLSKLKMRRTRYLSERNSLRMMLKNYAFFSLVTILPRYFILEIGEVVFFTMMGRPDLSWSVVKALGWNILHFWDTLKARRIIQNIRVEGDKEILSKMVHHSHKMQMVPAVIKNRNLH